MRYWLAKILGRADGPALTTCTACGRTIRREGGIRATGAPGVVCSDECAEEATDAYAF